MKTHELADSLITLAQVLKAGPNLVLPNWCAPPLSNNPEMDPSTAARNLSTLAALSQVTKEEWKELLAEWGLPVEVKASYSIRDLVGNVLKYLEENPDAVRKMHKGTARKNKKLASQLVEPLTKPHEGGETKK